MPRGLEGHVHVIELELVRHVVVVVFTVGVLAEHDLAAPNVPVPVLLPDVILRDLETHGHDDAFCRILERGFEREDVRDQLPDMRGPERAQPLLKIDTEVLADDVLVVVVQGVTVGAGGDGHGLQPQDEVVAGADVCTHTARSARRNSESKEEGRGDRGDARC